MIAHATNLEACVPLDNDERRAQWAARYYRAGLHRADFEIDEAGAALCATPLDDNDSTEDMG